MQLRASFHVALATFWLVRFADHVLASSQDEVLTERILQMSVTSAELSRLAYEENTAQYLVSTGSEGPSYFHPDYDELHFYTDEPDQAILAKKDGRCYLAIRGTTLTFDDWSQNFNFGDRNIYKDNNKNSGQFCEGRAGFSEFLDDSAVLQNVRADLIACYETCEDKDDCMVVTGHSQGGGSALQASILLYSYNPYIITFGDPPVIDPGCGWIREDRYIRYINSYRNARNDIAFDPFVYIPSLISGSVHYGYPILLGEDPAATKLLPDNFFPHIFDRNSDMSPHRLGPRELPYSYLARLYSLLLSNEFPVSTRGFTNGADCATRYHDICASGRCGDDSHVCVSKLDQLCVPNSCRENEDCTSGRCIYGACAPSDGVVLRGCPCLSDYQCESGECNQAWFSYDWTCD